jgi:outer membrane protein assembly factor BamB
MKKIFYSLLTAASLSSFAGETWHQAAGPDANWQVKGEAPIKWSAYRNENILWRTPMPEAGMSAVSIWKDKAFVTTHTPLESIKKHNEVKHILGFCLDAHTGKVLWKVELPGSAFKTIADGFTDGTVFAPICDGKNVWFFNRCGSIGCYDMEGNKVWLREFTPRYRHGNRQFEPVIIDDVILHVEVHDKVNGSKMQKWAAPGKKGKDSGVPKGVEPKDVWTYIHALDKKTGKILWRENAGTTVHGSPMVGKMADGSYAVLHSRGGGHGPLEKPYGYSLTSLKKGEAGKTLWSTDIDKVKVSNNHHWNEKYSYGFADKHHVILDTTTGKVLKKQPVFDGVDICRFDSKKNEWIKETGAKIKGKTTNTNHANIVVGKYHYFLAHDVKYAGRLNTETGKMEYLELPAQMMASKESRGGDKLLWTKPHKGNKPTNAQGMEIGRKGHNGSGWGHISAASPILVGKHLIWPVVSGTVYVLDTSKEAWDQSAITSINDLGEGGKTCTLSSFSFAHGRLYMHTMKEIICIGK